MSSRRTFIKSVGGSAILSLWVDRFMGANPNFLSQDGSIDWSAVRDLFPITNWSKVQMNSGSAGVMPIPVNALLLDLIREMNEKPPYISLGESNDQRKENLHALALEIGTQPERISIVRNTTEALSMIYQGLKLTEGDHIVAAEYDYPHALSDIENRVHRDSLSLTKLDFNLPTSDDEIVEEYRNVITAETKVVHLTYMTHREGHIMPVKELTKLAHSHGAVVVLDAAHAYAQFEHNVADLDVDFYATSLHKWLNAPHGTGLIYAKESALDHLHLYPTATRSEKGNMRQFEYVGTRSFAHETAIAGALDFHYLIGTKQKQDRLHELKKYWTEKTSLLDRVQLHTNTSREKSCAVATFSIDGIGNGKVKKLLYDQYHIHAKSVGGSFGGGIRVSPNIFSTFAELDQLCDGISQIVKKN